MPGKAEAGREPASVVFEAEARRSAAYAGGELIGECDFSDSDGVWTITHTGVRPAFGGRGIAGALVDKVAEAARAERVKIVPLCSYAAKRMTGRDEYRDVLKED